MDPTQWISVTVHPHAGKPALVELGPGRFEAWVKAKPIEGRANAAVMDLLAQALQIPAARLRLVKGGHKRHKVFRMVG